MEREDISPTNTGFAYFAGGGGLTIRDKAASLLFFAKEISLYRHVLTRPVTSEGLGFGKKIGFKPLSGKSELGKIHILNIDNQVTSPASASF